MDFSLTTLFVATSGTLASSGSTQDLTAGQLGVFRPDYSIATTGNIAAAKYFYIAQGRVEVVPPNNAAGLLPLSGNQLGSKRSDKIAASKVIEWYKVCAISNIPTQIQAITDWSLQCSEQITFAFRLHSSYIDTGFFNGLSRSFVINTPCCSCGANPCTDVSGTALQNFVDQVVAKGNADPSLSVFLTFSRFGTGSSSQLYITEKALTVYGNACDFEAYPWEYDRLWFRAFVIKGPVTTQDFIVNNACDIVATSTVIQRSDFGTGSSAEIKQLEKNLWSYQVNQFKHQYKYNSWNQLFTSYVVDGTFYDTFYIKFYPYDEFLNTWNPGVPQDSTVIVAFATGTGTTFQTLMETALGTVENVCATNPTTTTTTSTTSTSTTSTTTLIP